MAFLRVQGLTKSFGGLMAIHLVDLELQQGEILGLISPNDSGKTTLLNLITGFLTPDSGSIHFTGENITSLPRFRICQRGIGRTFQLTKSFLEFTVLQNVMVGRAYGHHPARSLAQAAEESLEILAFVGLADKASARGKELSLMQRKRLELARNTTADSQVLPSPRCTGKPSIRNIMRGEGIV